VPEGFKKAKISYSRDMPKLQPRLGRLSPEFLPYLDLTAQAVRRADKARPGESKVFLCYCGEAAGRPEFVPFAYYQMRAYEIDVSLSMEASKAPASDVLSNRISGALNG